MSRFTCRISIRQIQKSFIFMVFFVMGLLSIIASSDDNGGNAGVLQFNNVSYSATESTDPTIAVTVTRTAGSTGTVSVDYSTSDGSALDPSDYTAASGTLNWNDGDTAAKIFNVDITDDSSIESTESFDVVLSNVQTATLGTPSSATVTILDNDAIPVSGTVFAPNGSLAYKKPGWLQRIFATVFGNSINAAISDLVSTVPAATVSVYQVDSSGNLASATPISTSTTDSFGSFTLLAPLDALDVKYIVRASGTTENMDSRIVSTNINVDPATDASSHMLNTLISSFADITVEEMMQIQQSIEELITDIDTTGMNATALSSQLFSTAASRVGRYNIFRSKFSSGQICGNVQSAGASPLQDILIVVRDYDDWTYRANTYTDTSGNYCLNVPVAGIADPDGGNFSGEYIIGANNQTDDSLDPGRSASEWRGNGTTYTEFEANKVTVLNTTAVTGVDFILDPGVRVTGTVLSSGTAVEGAQVVIRDFDTRRRLATARVEQDGRYQVNVIPGAYLLTVQNKTIAPYASEVYDGASGTKNPNRGLSVSASAGDELIINFELEPGSQISGNINDGSPVANAQVKINIAGNANAAYDRSDRNGDYNIWLLPDSYDLYAHGQRSLAVDLSSSATVDFTAAISSISGQLIDSLSNPVRKAGVWLYSKPDALTAELFDVASADSYGYFTLYSSQTGDHLLLSRLARVSVVSGVVYMNQTRLLSGDVINISSVGSTLNLPAVSLPDGGVLTGHIYAGSSGNTTTPLVNFRVQVRDGGTTVDDRFIQVRTRSDGSYRVALPTGTYDRVKMRGATGAATGNGNCDAISIATGVTTVLNFYDGNNTCELNP